MALLRSFFLLALVCVAFSQSGEFSEAGNGSIEVAAGSAEEPETPSSSVESGSKSEAEVGGSSEPNEPPAGSESGGSNEPNESNEPPAGSESGGSSEPDEPNEPAAGSDEEPETPSSSGESGTMSESDDFGGSGSKSGSASGSNSGSSGSPADKLDTSDVAPFEDVTLVPDDLIFSIYMDGVVPKECENLKPEDNAPMVCCEQGMKMPFSVVFPDIAKVSCPATNFNGLKIQGYLGCDGGEVTFAEGCYQPSWFIPEDVDPATVSQDAKSVADCGCYSTSRGAGCRMVNSPADIGKMLNIESMKAVTQKSFALFGKCRKPLPPAPEVDQKDAIPIVVVSHRFVQAGKMDEYKKAYTDLSKYLKAKYPGIKAMFFSEDKGSSSEFKQGGLSSLVHDVQWFNDLESFGNPMDMNDATFMQKVAAVMGLYDASKEITGDVYGGWDDSVKAMMTSGPAKVNFHNSVAGFIKQTGEGLKGPPIIVSSRRVVQAGKMDELVAAGQKLANYYYENVPGVLAFTFAKDPKNPNMVHDLQTFANMDAFMAHVDMTDKPELMKRAMAFGMLYDAKVPFVGEAWSPDGKAVDTITSTFNAKFTFYDYPVVGFVDFSQFNPSDNHAEAFVNALEKYPKTDIELVEWASLMDDNVEFCRNGMCMQGVKMVTYAFAQFGSMINSQNTIYDIQEMVKGNRFVWFKATMETLKTNGGCLFSEDTPRILYYNNAGKITAIQQYIVPDEGLNAFLTAAMMGTKCDGTPAPPAAGNPMATEKGYLPTQGDVDRFMAGNGKDAKLLRDLFVASPRVCSDGVCATLNEYTRSMEETMATLKPGSFIAAVNSWKAAEGILHLQTTETFVSEGGCSLKSMVTRILYFDPAGKITALHGIDETPEYLFNAFWDNIGLPCTQTATTTTTGTNATNVLPSQQNVFSTANNSAAGGPATGR